MAPQLISARMVDDLKYVLGEHPGDSPVHLYVDHSVLRLPPEWAVDASNGLVGQITTILGPEAVIGG